MENGKKTTTKRQTKGGRLGLLVSFNRTVVLEAVFVFHFISIYCQAALSIVHVRSFLRGAYDCPHPSYPSPTSPSQVFSARVAIFVVVSFQWCTVFSPQSLRATWSMSVSWNGRLLCHVMSIYFLKRITPIVWIMSLMVILNLAVDDDYIYFSVQQCTVMKTIVLL